MINLYSPAHTQKSTTADDALQNTESVEETNKNCFDNLLRCLLLCKYGVDGDVDNYWHHRGEHSKKQQI